MLDMELYILLKATIEAQEPDFGIPQVTPVGSSTAVAGIPVYQSYQPTQQGVPLGPCAFLEIIGHERVGQPARTDFYDVPNSREVHTETQVMVTKFQLSALATQSTKRLTQYTAADIINLIGMILQNSTTVETLQAAGCGILLGRDTRNPKFIDDRGRFEASPSLDFSITHKMIVTKIIPVLQSTEIDIYRV